MQIWNMRERRSHILWPSSGVGKPVGGGAFTKYVRSCSGNPSCRYWYKSTHYPTGLLRAGIDTDYPQQYHTVCSQDVLWGALVQISRWPQLAGHLALFWHPPQFGDFFHPHFHSSSILTILPILSTYFCKISFSILVFFLFWNSRGVWQD